MDPGVFRGSRPEYVETPKRFPRQMKQTPPPALTMSQSTGGVSSEEYLVFEGGGAGD